MRRIRDISLLLALAAQPAFAATPPGGTIEIACMKNLTDGRVLVDGTLWDHRMHELGYVLADGAYVPYEVLRFEQQKLHDAIWADGLCRMKLLPVAK